MDGALATVLPLRDAQRELGAVLVAVGVTVCSLEEPELGLLGDRVGVAGVEDLLEADRAQGPDDLVSADHLG